MNKNTYEGVQVERCPDCGGAWLDWEELGDIVKTEEVEPQADLPDMRKAEDVKIDKRCPECGERLERFNYAVSTGVFLDRCPHKHGIWLDPGELEHVQTVMQDLKVSRFGAVNRFFRMLYRKGWL